VKDHRQFATFGKRREPHTLIIARGDEIRHVTIRPWLSAFIGSVIAAMAVGYLLATSYLVLRDDLMGAAVARQARMQQAYEDRISALRAQVDRITSRQLLDQRVMEGKVAELIERQQELTARQGRLGPLIERAEGKDLPDSKPGSAEAKPDLRAGLSNSGAALAYAAIAPTAPGDGFMRLLRKSPAEAARSEVNESDRLFLAITRSLQTIESEQLTRVKALAEDAYKTADAISGALASAGLVAADDYGVAAAGGPLMTADPGAAFDSVVDDLDEALAKLDQIKTVARRLPVANPAAGRTVSSRFGVRRDPLIGSPAFHSGMDFRAPLGAPVRSSGDGRVVHAGWNGGYGRMVEIDHGDGWTTRYAHLSKISVAEGERVKSGAIVGAVGSSGRSTGPHLHYEIRRKGEATDPLRFIKAGRTIAKLM
jgi:murein DD-endopeptidase MepM/ murein hydrolase activator NlpD